MLYMLVSATTYYQEEKPVYAAVNLTILGVQILSTRDGVTSNATYCHHHLGWSLSRWLLVVPV